MACLCCMQQCPWTLPSVRPDARQSCSENHMYLYMESIREFRKTTKNSVTHVQRLPAAAAAAERTFWTPAAGCRALRCQAELADRSEMRQIYWPMAKCGLLLPLLAIALPTPPPTVAGTVAIALLCDTDETHKSSLLYWPHTWAHSTRREDCDAGRGAQIRSRGTSPTHWLTCTGGAGGDRCDQRQVRRRVRRPAAGHAPRGDGRVLRRRALHGLRPHEAGAR